MNTKTMKLCGECRQRIPADAVLGLCPKCLMKAGLKASSKANITVAADAFREGPETETKEILRGVRLGYIGDYELVEEIARGGMGVVYRARQTSLNRIVAVKMIRSGDLANESEVQRFRTEAQAAAQLQHPNIVAIHEIAEHQGQHYYSMDFVEGRNLAQVADGRPVAARSAAEWLRTIAGAVQFAHQHGVLHRDLKPQNIMLDAAGRPTVLDFGLAKNLANDSTPTNTGAVMGSPSYMSPEQARGRNDLVGPASDVYSLGAVLYELLTGRPPFSGASPMDTLSQVVNEEPPGPRSLNPSTPVDLETICLKCLEKEPVRRYPTARELGADLGRFLEGEPVQGKPAGALRRTMSWFRGHRWVFSLALSMLVLTLLGLVYGLWEQTRFLTWLNAHPGYVKTPGPLQAALHSLEGRLGIFSLISYPIICVLFQKLSTKASWNKIFSAPAHPLEPGVAAAFGAISAVGIVVSLFIASRALQMFVWEGIVPSAFFISMLLMQVCMATRVSMEVLRQQTRIEYAPAPLSPEQLASIHEVIFAGRTSDAIERWRAATGAHGTHALANIVTMEAALRRERPESFSTEVLNRPLGDPVGYVWLSFGTTFLMGVSMLLLPLIQTDSTLSLLGHGFLIGACVRALSYGGMTRWRRAYRAMPSWTRLLSWMMIAGFAVAIVGGGLALLSSGLAPKLALYTCGLLAGWLPVHWMVRKWMPC